MRKREKFIISSALLALGLVGTQALSVDVRPIAIALFTLATYLISAWALSTNINGIEWFTILPYPALYALSVSLFYFLLPSHILSRIFVIGLFGVGMYALYLTANIFAIGKVKTIQLLRAAHAVTELFLLVMSLFYFNFIFSLQLHAAINALLCALVTFPLVLSPTWAIELERKLSRRVLIVSLLFALVIGELAFVLSLLPAGLWTISLFLGAIIYVGYGLMQQYFVGRLFRRTVQEYMMLGIFVTISLLLLIQWK